MASAQNPMRARAGALATLVLTALVLLLVGLHAVPQAPRQLAAPLAFGGALGLLAFAVASARAVGTPTRVEAPRWLALLFVPMVALFVPFNLLPGAALELTASGGQYICGSTAPVPWTKQPASNDSRTWTLKDWYVRLNGFSPTLVGSAVQVEGYVIHDSALGPTGFYIARGVVTAGEHESQIVGLPVAWPLGQILPADTWISLKGTLRTTTIDGATWPMVVATQITPTMRPYQPALYSDS